MTNSIAQAAKGADELLIRNSAGKYFTATSTMSVTFPFICQLPSPYRPRINAWSEIASFARNASDQSKSPFLRRLISALADFDDPNRHSSFSTVDEFLADLDRRIRDLNRREG